MHLAGNLLAHEHLQFRQPLGLVRQRPQKRELQFQQGLFRVDQVQGASDPGLERLESDPQGFIRLWDKRM